MWKILANRLATPRNALPALCLAFLIACLVEEPVQAQSGSAPVIVQAPTNLTVNAGQYAYFTVAATGSPEPHYRWQFQGADLDGKTNFWLSLPPVTRTNAGDYTVTASNIFGVVTSTVATLTVRYFPPTIESVWGSQTALAGRDVTFVVYDSAAPPPIYEWFFNGIELATTTSDTLNLRNVRATNAGTYSLVVSNSEGTATNPYPIYLTVDAAPTNAGSLDIDFYPGLGANASVNAVAIQSDGKILIGGAFTNVGGVSRWHIARLEANGSLDGGFDPPCCTNGVVNAISVQPDGKVILATGALWYSPTVLRLNVDGTLDWDLNVPYGQTSASMYSIAIQSDGKILYGGYSQLLGRLNPDGTPDLLQNVYYPPPPGSAGDASTFSLIAQTDGKLLIGGDFGLARLQANGAIDLGFSVPIPNGSVLALLQQPDGKILVGGSFTNINGASVWNAARLNSDGSLDPSFNLGFRGTGSISAIAMQRDGKVLVGGSFAVTNGIRVPNNIARLNPDGSLDPTFDPYAAPDGSVRSIAIQNDWRVLVGGTFDRVDGAPRGNVARLNNDPPRAPAIAGQPQSQSVIVGQDATFWVKAGHADSPAFQWFFDGAALGGAVDPVLRLTNVQTAQAGDYTVVVSNVAGAVTSMVAVLTVTLPPNGSGAADLTFDPGVGPNNTVLAVAGANNGQYLVAGSFTEINGVPRSHIARVNLDGSLDVGFDVGLISGGYPSTIYAMAVQPDGKILIGGNFTAVNGTTRNGIARINGAGSLDNGFDSGVALRWAQLPTPTIYAMAIQEDGNVVIGGDFDTTNSFGTIARLRSDGSLDASFSLNIQIPGSPVWTLAVQTDGKIIAGGYAWMARFDRFGNRDYGFNPPALGAALVRSLAVQLDGKVLVGLSRGPSIMRLLTNGSPDPSFQTNISNGAVQSIAFHTCDKILIGGSFYFSNSAVPQAFASLQSDGSVDPAFAPGLIDGGVSAIFVRDDNSVMIGGDFVNISGVSRPRIARLLGEPRLPPGILVQPAKQSVTRGQNVLLSVVSENCFDIAFQWQLNGTNVPGATNSTLSLSNVHPTNSGSYTVLVSDGGGTSNSQPAALTVLREPRNPGSADIDFYPPMITGGDVRTITLQDDGKVLIGGSFTNLNGLFVNRLVRLNADGSPDTNYVPGRFGNGEIKAVVVQPDGYVVFAGSFTSFSGSAVNRIGRVSPNGYQDVNFAPMFGASIGYGTDGTINSVVLEPNGEITIGGFFGHVNGIPRSGVARYLSDGYLDSTYQPASVPGAVTALARQHDDKLVIIGSFTSVGEFARARIARLNADGSVDTTFDPGEGVTITPNALALTKDGKILIGGAFTTVNGLPRNRIVRLNSDGSVDSTFDPGAGPNVSVWSIFAQNDGKVLIGGTFQSVNHVSRNHIARLNADGSLDTSFDPGQGADNTVLAIAVDDRGKIFIGGSFTQYNGLPRAHIARINGDLLLFNPVHTGSTFHLSVSTFPDEIYHLEFNHSLDPASWSSLPGVVGDGTVKLLEDEQAGDTPTFYRVRRE